MNISFARLLPRRDLFWEKPTSQQEIRMFLDCLEALLGREDEPGFRGVQSKSLVDLIQLECISHSSSVLRITNGPLTGRIWITTVISSTPNRNAQRRRGFRKILGLENRQFESLPPEPAHPRSSKNHTTRLLLETAQAIDENNGSIEPHIVNGERLSPLTALSQIAGVEFVLALKSGPNNFHESRGLENPDRIAA